MYILNLTVYIVSSESIYVPGEPYLIKEFSITPITTVLGLSLFSL